MDVDHVVRDPQIDVAKAADEVKAYVDSRKMDLVDWGYTKIECYPDPNDETYPELKKFASLWNSLFDYADTITESDGTGFPKDIILNYEAKTLQIQDAVNGDTVFWQAVRDQILPLYSVPAGTVANEGLVQTLEQWKERWKSIQIVYDPIGLEVEVTKILTDPKTGKKYREPIRKRPLPPGFIIRIL